MKVKLYYVYDPMCSWCWGYAPTWNKLRSELASMVETHYCVGGLAEDSEQPMTNEMQKFLRQTWHKISQELGTEFNFDFWQKCQPRRSTYPACRAMLIARSHHKEQHMLAAIQQGYYLQALNPSEPEVLCNLAAQIGLDADCFKEHLNSEPTQSQLMAEIQQARAMPIAGFPSLVLEKNGEYLAIPIDYKNWRTTFDVILKSI